MRIEMEIAKSPLLRPKEACSHLLERHGIRRAPETLSKNRCLGLDGPEFVKIGRQVFYSTDALDAWARRITSEPRRSTRDSAVAPEAAA
jgi:hypothetical protein